jgi:undecaprenyl diphosphate synthase
MDGNGRWAKQRGLPRIMGHKAGVDAVREIVKACIEKKIEVLTLFAFSSENWQRPASEVSFLMDLFIAVFEREVKKLHAENIQLRVMGDRSRFEEKLRDSMQNAEQLTANNTGLKLVIAANYGGQWDMQEAIRHLAIEVEQGRLTSQQISPELIQSKLASGDLPDPDFFIRTSGEQRVSNFMLWQLAYTELYFTDVLWPDFTAAEFERALDFYTKRERRFGSTSEQLRDATHA